MKNATKAKNEDKKNSPKKFEEEQPRREAEEVEHIRISIEVKEDLHNKPRRKEERKRENNQIEKNGGETENDKGMSPKARPSSEASLLQRCAMMRQQMT